MSSKSRTGSTLESFFEERGELEEVQDIALRLMLADELKAFATKKKWTLGKLAAELKTSRPQLDRLLDPDPKKGITTTTLGRAAGLLGKRVQLVDAA